MNNVIRGRSIDTIFVLIVFSTFAISVLIVLMLGANIYRNINENSREDEAEQTALSYIWTKAKNFDNADSIRVDTFNGNPALYIREHFGGTEFNTIIYHYDGWLYELFSEAALTFSPTDGIRIVKVDDLSFEAIDDGLIRMTSGNMSLHLSPRSR